MTEIRPSTFDIQTKRLHLRTLDAHDEDFYCSIYTDAEILRFVGPPMAIERARRSFHKTLALMHAQPMRWLSLTIIDKQTGQRLGICGAPQFDPTAERLEIGILLLVAARGAGFAKEAKIALAQRLFACLPVGEIWVQYEAGNAAAERLFTSVGFQPCSGQIADRWNLEKRIMSIQRATWCKPGSIADNSRNEDV